MRPLSFALAAIAGGLTLCAGLEVAAGEDPRPAPTLSAKEVATYFEPYLPEVRGCYLANARSKTADGTLRLELIIHPDGKVFRFGFVAAGVVKPWLPRLDACLRKLPPAWSFPARRGYTSAVLPFLFQRTRAPGAGPIESCWDARGCPPGTPGGQR